VNDPQTGLNTALLLVDAAIASGADDAEVYGQFGPTFRIALQWPHSTENGGWQNELALRVWCGQQTSVLVTDQTSPQAFNALALSAVSQARRSSTSLDAQLCDTRGSRIFPCTRSLIKQTRIEERDALKQLLEEAKRVPRFASAIVNADFLETSPWTVIANSRGCAAAYERHESTVWLWVEHEDGRLAEGLFGPTFSESERKLLVRRLADRASFLDQRTYHVPPGPCEVLLSPSATAGVAATLGTLLAADNVLCNLPALLKHMDQLIAGSAVTVIDDGTVTGGMQGRPVDDEGTPTCSTTLIEEGRLRAFLHTRRTSHQLGVTPNGKATRTALWALPRSAPSNIYIQAGHTVPTELWGQIRRGLIVLHVREPGRIQGGGGRFTITVDGWWVENGEIMYPVAAVNLSANIFALLRSIRQCGNDLEFSFMSNGAGGPSLLVDEMWIS